MAPTDPGTPDPKVAGTEPKLYLRDPRDFGDARYLWASYPSSKPGAKNINITGKSMKIKKNMKIHGNPHLEDHST